MTRMTVLRRARLGLLLPLLLALSACEQGIGADNSDADAQGGTTLFASLRNAVQATRAAPPMPVAPRYDALLKTPGMRGQISFVEESGAYDVTLLEQVSAHGVETWLAQDGTSFSMRDGMLVATRGLGRDIMSGDARETLALLRAGQGGMARRFTTELDGNFGTRQVTYMCEVALTERTEIELSGAMVPVDLMSETCHGTELGFLNIYWVDRRSREIRQSRQFSGRLVGMIAFRELPPATLQAMQRAVARPAGGQP